MRPEAALTASTLPAVAELEAWALSSAPLQTRAELVADRLRQAILAGEIPAGTPLRQVEMSKRFGVSTTPVREAFIALRREGLLLGDPHRGVVVFRPSRADVQENYEIRIELESLAASKAAVHITDDDLHRLDELLSRMRDVAAAGDMETYIELNHRLHLGIYAAAQRPRLCRLIETLREASAAYIRIFAAKQADPTQMNEEHQAVVDALRTRSAERSGAAMRAHLTNNLEFIVSQLRPDDQDA
jgi:DNA-binding GntR family transcriptional regulator